MSSHILIKFGWQNHYLLPCDANSGIIVAALGNAQKVTIETKQDSSIYNAADDNEIEVSFVTPRFGERSTVEAELLERVRNADNRWIEYYNKATAAEKRAKELEEKLKSLQENITKVTA